MTVSQILDANWNTACMQALLAIAGEQAAYQATWTLCQDDKRAARAARRAMVATADAIGFAAR
jgi:hypothetical protein